VLKPEKMRGCSCGRSPVGRCIGWHILSEERYQEKLTEYNKMSKKQKTGLYHAKAIDGLGE